MAVTNDDSDAVCTDSDDIAASLAGDHGAFARLVERYQTDVARYLWRFTRNEIDCEELTQNVFVEVFLSLASFSRKAVFWSWIKVIATRVGYRYWQRQTKSRKLGSVELHEASVMDQSSLDIVEQTVRNDEAGRLFAMLQELSPRDRLVLTLMYIEEHSVAEIAELTGWSQTLVKVQAFRARNKLKNLVERRDAESNRRDADTGESHVS